MDFLESKCGISLIVWFQNLKKLWIRLLPFALDIYHCMDFMRVDPFWQKQVVRFFCRLSVRLRNDLHCIIPA